MDIREIKIAGSNFIIHELDDTCDSATGQALTGSWLWNSALVLADFISTHVAFTNKSVLELGAGTGLPGLTAARLGANRVILTDMKPLLPGLARNVEVNGLRGRVEVRELVWGSDELRLGRAGEFDVVLMSDVFYDAEQMAALGKTVRRVCGAETGVWAASEVRPSTSECLKELVSQGFSVVEFPSQLGGGKVVEEDEDCLDDFAVFRLIPPIAR